MTVTGRMNSRVLLLLSHERAHCGLSILKGLNCPHIHNLNLMCPYFYDHLKDLILSMCLLENHLVPLHFVKSVGSGCMAGVRPTCCCSQCAGLTWTLADPTLAAPLKYGGGSYRVMNMPGLMPSWGQILRSPLVPNLRITYTDSMFIL